MELQRVMTDERDFTTSAKSGMNARRTGAKLSEEQQSKKAVLKDESLTDCLMEKICDPKNLNLAYKRVKTNKGSPGIDGMTVEAMGKFIADHKERLLESLLLGSYQPQAVREVEIPKIGGGTRQLGIPTVLDRL